MSLFCECLPQCVCVSVCRVSVCVCLCMCLCRCVSHLGLCSCRPCALSLLGLQRNAHTHSQSHCWPQ